MTAPYRITRGDSADLAFAVTCLLAGALTPEEFADWLYLVIERTSTDDLPTWVFDMLDHVTSKAPDRRSLAHLETMAGFAAGDPTLTADRHKAIDGIAWLRRESADPGFDVVTGRKAGLAALGRCPEIRARFADQFPFVSLPDRSEAF